MSGPLLMDVDLRDEALLLPAGHVLALLWWGDHVLGEVSLTCGREGWAQVRAALLSEWRPVVDGLRLVTSENAAPIVGPSDVTVVVCTRDRPTMLSGCLGALEQLDPAPREIIVVDNAATTHATAQLADRHGARRVVEPRPGLCHARNAGWRAARTAVIAYTDDDARPHRKWVAALGRGFVAPAVGCVTGLVVAAELVTPAQRLFERNGGMRKGFTPRLFGAACIGLQGHRVGVGVNMAFRREALETMGGFDVRLGPGRSTRGGDDLDAFVRVLSSGYVAAYRPDAVVRHIHRRDLPGLVNQYRDNGVGFAALLHKHTVEDHGSRSAAHSEQRRWRRQRHVRSLLGAVRRRDVGAIAELAAEIEGSTRGRRALESETALTSPGGADG